MEAVTLTSEEGMGDLANPSVRNTPSLRGAECGPEAIAPMATPKPKATKPADNVRRGALKGL